MLVFGLQFCREHKSDLCDICKSDLPVHMLSRYNCDPVSENVGAMGGG